MVERAKLEKTDRVTKATTEGWYVLHASEAPWFSSPRFGKVCKLEGDVPFPQLGVNIRVIEPGKPACLYHREDAQEDFVVLAGACRLLVEDEELELRAGHFVHCPPWTNHVFVGAGEGPCVILMMGHRPEKVQLRYPVSEAAAKYGASAAEETPDPKVAYGKRDYEPVEPAWPFD